MSQANVEIAKRVIDAFNGRDVDSIFKCVNSDIEWFPALPGVVEGDGYRGREGIEMYFEEISNTWEEYSVVGQDFRDLGNDRVLVLSRVKGRGRGSGVQVDSPIGVIYDFRDGKMSRVRAYLNHGEALRAAGVSD